MTEPVLLKNAVYFIFYNFFIYSFFGWIYESVYVSIRQKQLINRGFLNGPVIPIYGMGATIVYIVLYPVKDCLLLVFVCGMLLATVLEYVTSYLMEKLFHAKWWDYSNMKFNLKGRIAFGVSVFWGILSVVMIQFIQPSVNTLIAAIPVKIGIYAGFIIVIIFTADLIVTVASIVKMDQWLTNMHKLRTDFVEYIESTKLYETKEELVTKFSESAFSELLDNFKERLEESRDKLSAMKEDLERQDKKHSYEEIAERLKNYKNNYQNSTKKRKIIEIRILKAFPNLKAIGRDDALKELKKREKKHKID